MCFGGVGKIVNSKEYVVANCLSKLLNPNNLDNKKELLNEIYCIISYADLKGIEIYLHLEDLLNKTPHSDKELFLTLRETFLNEFVSQKSIIPYETWQHFARVIYCLEPVLYYYSIEKEFFGSWHPEYNKWIFNF